MHVETLRISNFRCFGPQATTITLETGLTAFLGSNASGKTAALAALQRMFGVIPSDRRIVTDDFHRRRTESEGASERCFFVDVVFGFEGLDAGDVDAARKAGVPQVLRQMTAASNGLKCRIRLEATWTDDGTSEGAIDSKLFFVRTLDEKFDDSMTVALSEPDRRLVQVIYVPARRDGDAQVSAFLKGRIWRAAKWSEAFRNQLEESTTALDAAFSAETPTKAIQSALTDRWEELHAERSERRPQFRPSVPRIDELARRVALEFLSERDGWSGGTNLLSDGQRSLLHLSMVAAAIDLENGIQEGKLNDAFWSARFFLPSLTLLLIEEPENSLAPFFLSRIVKQLNALTSSSRAQAILSSHSSGMVRRVRPEQIRHFRLSAGVAWVRTIALPEGDDEAEKYVRTAVRAYPEIYFAQYVVFGEGASEELVLPTLASAMGFEIDPSFVAVVPLSGRHTLHFWRLVSQLGIPYATVLDLDLGRVGGGFGRVRTVVEQLIEFGTTLEELSPGANSKAEALEALEDSETIGTDAELGKWVSRLRSVGVFFCEPLDLDWSMLLAFRAAYVVLPDNARGPDKSDAVVAVLGGAARLGDEALQQRYTPDATELFRWYRYLFLGRGKPTSHMSALSRIEPDKLAEHAPEELRLLLGRVRNGLNRSNEDD